MYLQTGRISEAEGWWKLWDMAHFVVCINIMVADSENHSTKHPLFTTLILKQTKNNRRLYILLKNVKIPRNRTLGGIIFSLKYYRALSLIKSCLLFFVNIHPSIYNSSSGVNSTYREFLVLFFKKILKFL